MILTYTILNFGDLLGSQLTNVLTILADEVVVMLAVELVLILTIFYSIFMVPEAKQPNEGDKESFLGECFKKSI